MRDFPVDEARLGLTKTPPPAVRREPRQARSRATVAAIREAAARVLVAEGYERATTNRIAEVAGVSIGTLYQYFDSRDAVLDALAADLLAAVIAGAGEAMEAPNADGLVERLDRLVTGVLRVVARYPSVLRHLDAVPGSSFRARLTDAKALGRAFLLQVLDAHRDEVKVSDRALSARILTDLGEGILNNLSPEDDVDRIGRETARLVVAYLRAG
jgi:AcrR family transcriptional regulator